MIGGTLMILTGSLVIAQVTRGQALQRLGIIGTGGGITGFLSGPIGQVKAVGGGIGAGFGHFGGL